MVDTAHFGAQRRRGSERAHLGGLGALLHVAVGVVIRIEWHRRLLLTELPHLEGLLAHHRLEDRVPVQLAVAELAGKDIAHLVIVHTHAIGLVVAVLPREYARPLRRMHAEAVELVVSEFAIVYIAVFIVVNAHPVVLVVAPFSRIHVTIPIVIDAQPIPLSILPFTGVDIAALIVMHPVSVRLPIHKLSRIRRPVLEIENTAAASFVLVKATRVNVASLVPIDAQAMLFVV